MDEMQRQADIAWKNANAPATVGDLGNQLEMINSLASSMALAVVALKQLRDEMELATKRVRFLEEMIFGGSQS